MTLNLKTAYLATAVGLVVSAPVGARALETSTDCQEECYVYYLSPFNNLSCYSYADYAFGACIVDGCYARYGLGPFSPGSPGNVCIYSCEDEVGAAHTECTHEYELCIHACGG